MFLDGKFSNLNKLETSWNSHGLANHLRSGPTRWTGQLIACGWKRATCGELRTTSISAHKTKKVTTSKDAISNNPLKIQLVKKSSALVFNRFLNKTGFCRRFFSPKISDLCGGHPEAPDSSGGSWPNFSADGFFGLEFGHREKKLCFKRNYPTIKVV